VNCEWKRNHIRSHCLGINIYHEDSNVPLFVIDHPMFFSVLGVVYIFVFWVLWKMVQCLKNVVASLQEIAVSLKSKS